MSAASQLADALWGCMEARAEEKEARGDIDAPDSWEYVGRSYFDAIDRADANLGEVLEELFVPGDLADPGRGEL